MPGRWGALALPALACDDTGEPRFDERVVARIQNGRHVVVYPREPATATAKCPAR